MTFASNNSFLLLDQDIIRFFVQMEIEFQIFYSAIANFIS